MRCLAAFALLAGCTGGIDYPHFPAALEDARCAYYVRCGVAAGAAECQAYYDRISIANRSTETAVDMSIIIYDGGIAQRCLDAYAALSCDVTELTGDELSICSDVLTGTLAVGDTCAFDRECASNNCSAPACPTSCCSGTCEPAVALPSVGQPCTALCEGDAFCGLDQICHASLPAGAACNAEPCAYGLYCAGRTGTMAGTCRPLPHLGQACENACAEIGATCYAGTCVELALLDDPCTSNAQCSMFYECSSMQCALFPTLGMPCTTTCYEASYCDGTTCVAQKPTGSTCVRNDECASHYCANSACADPPVCF
ncbi:MAG TPA: hypothetical protein VIV11_17895 [Kofleriaceae bacterium]